MTRSSVRSRAAVWAGVLAAWTLLAAAFAVGSSLAYMMSYNPPVWGLSLLRSLTEWYAWAALTPLIVWLARRFRLAGDKRLRNAIVLALAGIPIAMLKIVLSQILRSMAGFTGYALPGNVVAQYLIFWGVVTIAHVAAYYRAEGERELRASRAEARLAETRLQLLKMQLHPHFLFNTLNAVSELVHENPAAADRMIARLSHLLRETLDVGSVDLVPLSREIELLAHYVEIQRARFGARLDVSIEADDEVRKALVPIFILQPLVENAIKHGLAAHIRAGRIAVRATRDADRTVVEIVDDGPGITAGDVKDGVGLGNTRARLQEMYGSRQTFDVTNAPGGGTLARLSLPWQIESTQGAQVKGEG
jgi:two-component system LytT family sensor kinase